MHTHTIVLSSRGWCMQGRLTVLRVHTLTCTPNPPTNITPTSFACVKLSGKIPYGHENSTPLN